MTSSMPPEEMLAEGFARQMAALAQNGAHSALLAKAARAVSLSTSAGHVCVDLQEALDLREPELTVAREQLLASGLVAAGSAGKLLPLIIDEHDRLYLARYFYYEQRLAENLMKRAAALPAAADDADGETLDRLFARNRERLGEKTDWQKVACALAMGNRITVIAGGPGTGKTTTVVNLLAALLTKEPNLRIALAAPTGKAAQRMREAIRGMGKDLPDTLRESLPAEVHTIHRLLGVAADRRRFRHHADNPLDLDVLVVDEASMLDLALAVRLLEAVPAGARVVFLGDKDQLAAVEAGAVFHEICSDPSLGADCRQRLARLTGFTAAAIQPPPVDKPSPLQDCVVWLTESLRYGQNSGIGLLAADINRGDARAAVARLSESRHGDLDWVRDQAPRPAASTLTRLASGFEDYLISVKAFSDDLPSVFAAFDRFRILCATRQSDRGVEQINRSVAVMLRAALRHPADDGRSPWYPGRPVMVLANDYALGLFNGDVGLTLPDESGRLLVHFPLPGGTFSTLAPARLPPHETAFAMTVHKSQGSEFAEVAFILPAHGSRVLTRELAYTAVTRAKSRVTIYGAAEILAQAVASPTRRHSGLPDRLRER